MLSMTESILLSLEMHDLTNFDIMVILSLESKSTRGAIRVINQDKSKAVSENFSYYGGLLCSDEFGC